MRFVPVAAIAATLAVTAFATAGHSQKPDAQVDARSLSLLDQARTARTAGQVNEANDLLETALVVDPKNRRAFHELAEIAKAQGLPGKAIRYYREALELEPNDTVALAGQGDALMQKGAVLKARENLARLNRLCASGCPEASRLATVIEKGPPPAVQSAQAPIRAPLPGAEGATRKPD